MLRETVGTEPLLPTTTSAGVVHLGPEETDENQRRCLTFQARTAMLLVALVIVCVTAWITLTNDWTTPDDS